MSREYLPVSSMDELDSLFESSSVNPVVLFKHSNSCGTSAYIYHVMSQVQLPVNIVTVQERRDISNAIEQRTGIRHQSPQVFVVRDGKVVYSASHYSISPEAIAAAAERAE